MNLTELKLICRDVKKRCAEKNISVKLKPYYVGRGPASNPRRFYAIDIYVNGEYIGDYKAIDEKADWQTVEYILEGKIN